MSFVAWIDYGEQLAFLPLDDDLAMELLPDLTLRERSEHWHLVTTEAEDLTQGEGLIALLSELRLTAWLAPVLTWLRAERFLDGLDAVLGRIKGRMGKVVPDLDGPRRYP